jgi:DNA-binding response OmpR family regulator
VSSNSEHIIQPREDTRDHKPPPLILIIDDNEDICDVLQMTLNAEGFITRTAHSGEQALKILDVCMPDVILLDYLISGILGSDGVTSIVQARSLKSQIVLLTGIENPTEKARALNIAHSLQKPYNSDELIRLINELLNSGC